MDVFNFFKQLGMNKREKADEIVKQQVLWSLGAGLVPVPLLDIAAVTAVQVGMVKKLCELYEVKYDESSSKAIITSLVTSTLASVGASFVKAIPLVGTLLGGASMAILSGGATYAIGQVFIRHFEQGGTLETLDSAAARRVFEEELERGKEVAARLQKEWMEKQASGKTDEPASAAGTNATPAAPSAQDDVFTKLEKLAALRQKGIITEAEFELKKQELLLSL